MNSHHKGGVGMNHGHNNTGGKASPTEAVKCIEKMHAGHEDHARAHPHHHGKGHSKHHHKMHERERY